MENVNNYIKLDYWGSQISELKDKYQNNSPFPHILLDDFLPKESALESFKAFPPIDSEVWTNFLHFNKKSNELADRNIIPSHLLHVIDALNSDEFVAFLEELTGIKGIIADHDIEAGGLLMTRKGGFLNVHADFRTHPRNKNWRRRVNVLVYMNKDWKEEYGGHIELWSKDMKKREHRFLPSFNRCLIFNTDKDCLHGHPDILDCPENDGRKVIALYYFQDEKKASSDYTTEYKARPDDGIKSVFIKLDYLILKMYNRIKTTFGIRDTFASDLVKFFSSKSGKK